MTTNKVLPPVQTIIQHIQLNMKFNVITIIYTKHLEMFKLIGKLWKKIMITVQVNMIIVK